MNGVIITRRLALAGSIGPIVFVAIAILVTALEWDFLRRLGWHLLQDSSVPYPSSTAMGPYGWLQTINFAQAGLAILAVAIGLWRSVTPRPRAGIAFVALAGIAVLLSTFTTDGTTKAPTTWHGTIHALAFLLLVFSTVLGALVLAFQLRRDPDWRSVAAFAPAVPIVLIVSLVLTGAARQAGGLLNVIGILAIFALYWILAIRMLSITRRRA